MIEGINCAPQYPGGSHPRIALCPGYDNDSGTFSDRSTVYRVFERRSIATLLQIAHRNARRSGCDRVHNLIQTGKSVLLQKGIGGHECSPMRVVAAAWLYYAVAQWCCKKR